MPPARDAGATGGSSASTAVLGGITGIGGATVGVGGITGAGGASVASGGVSGAGGKAVGSGGRDASVDRASGGSGGSGLGGAGGSSKCTSFCMRDFPCNATAGPMHSCYNDHQYYPKVTYDCSQTCGGCPCSGQSCDLDMTQLIDCPPGQLCVRTTNSYAYVPPCAPPDAGADTAIDVAFSPIDARTAPGG